MVRGSQGADAKQNHRTACLRIFPPRATRETLAAGGCMTLRATACANSRVRAIKCVFGIHILLCKMVARGG